MGSAKDLFGIFQENNAMTLSLEAISEHSESQLVLIYKKNLLKPLLSLS
jgi:hypothetical protein